MSKKHFIAIAAVLCRASHTADSATVDTIARELADVFANANPLFDRARFLRACGVRNNWTNFEH